MIYLHLLYELPAVLSGTLLIAYLSPWKVSPRVIPLLMFLMALLVLGLPQIIGLALCLTLLAGYFADKLGMSFTGHEPVSLTLPKVSLRRPRIVVKDFVKAAYPDPETVADQEEDDPDEPPQPEPGDQVSTVPSYVPKI